MDRNGLTFIQDQALINSDYDVRLTAWRRRDWTPNQEQIKRGLADRSALVRRAVWKRGDWTPSQEQIEQGLADSSLAIRHMARIRQGIERKSATGSELAL